MQYPYATGTGQMTPTLAVGDFEGQVVGVFYHAKVRHLALYVPHRRPPGKTLCGRPAGVATRSDDNLCGECRKKAEAIFGALVFR